MRVRSPFGSALVLVLTAALVIPQEIPAQSGQRAGQVSRLIPAVSLQRGQQQVAAAAQALVLWEDVVNTQRMGRARISLDDGSLLNVGSESSLRITKHDAGAQQTQLELTYGRMRTKAVRLARPGSKYEVRTPVGVAGVIGTDFYLALLNGLLVLVVFEGTVRFCNLNNECVNVGPGNTSTIRGAAIVPDPPQKATPAQLTEAAQSTLVEEPRGPGLKPLKPWQTAILIGVVAGTAVGIAMATRGNATQGQKPCPPTQPVCP
jgi:hypothetical protein